MINILSFITIINSIVSKYYVLNINLVVFLVAKLFSYFVLFIWKNWNDFGIKLILFLKFVFSTKPYSSSSKNFSSLQLS